MLCICLFAHKCFFFLLEYILVSHSLHPYPWQQNLMCSEQLVFYIFYPALVASNLADTVTASSLATMWVQFCSLLRYFPFINCCFKFILFSICFTYNFWLNYRWFMPVNILLTFIIGSALGWILIKITRPPQHLHALILGCCSAGRWL